MQCQGIRAEPSRSFTNAGTPGPGQSFAGIKSTLEKSMCYVKTALKKAAA